MNAFEKHVSLCEKKVNFLFKHKKSLSKKMLTSFLLFEIRQTSNLPHNRRWWSFKDLKSLNLPTWGQFHQIGAIVMVHGIWCKRCYLFSPTWLCLTLLEHTTRSYAQILCCKLKKSSLNLLVQMLLIKCGRNLPLGPPRRMSKIHPDNKAG